MYSVGNFNSGCQSKEVVGAKEKEAWLWKSNMKGTCGHDNFFYLDASMAVFWF